MKRACALVVLVVIFALFLPAAEKSSVLAYSSGATISYDSVVEVYDNKGVVVRDSPAGTRIGAKPKGERGLVIGYPTSASLGDTSYIWWKILWEDGLIGWSAEGHPGGASYLKPLAPCYVTLTLYVHEGSSTGPSSRV